jgi:hypothetical protein
MREGVAESGRAAFAEVWVCEVARDRPEEYISVSAEPTVY